MRMDLDVRILYNARLKEKICMVFTSLFSGMMPTLRFCFAAALLPNGGFENGGDGWTLKDGWGVVPGAGRRGGACAVYDTKGEKLPFPQISSATFPVKPGGLYRFEAYVKREGMKNNVQLFFSALTAEGKWIENTVGRRMVDNDVNAKGWDRYEGMTFYLPKNARFARLCVIGVGVKASGGVTGRISLDDFAVYEESSDVIDTLHSSVYRDLAADGDVRFVAPYHLDPGEHPADSLAAMFEWRDASGASKRMDGSVDGEKAEISLAVKDLAMGEHSVVCTLREKATGKILASATNAFTRVEKLPERMVWIDSHNRFIVHGRPFFSLGMSWSEMASRATNRVELLDLYAQGPFNSVNTYIRDLNTEDLDFFHSRNMMVKCNLKDAFLGVTGLWPMKEIKTEADEERYVAKIVNRCKDHPALLYWYTNDEFPLPLRKRATKRYWFIRALDDQHPAGGCLDKPHLVRLFMPSFDLIGTDPYPVGKLPDLSTATEWANKTREEVFGMRPLLQTVQAFDWSWYFPKGYFKNMHFPTRGEMRSLAWQHLIAGANGLSFFIFDGIFKRFEREEAMKHFQDVCAVAGEIKDLFPVLLSTEEPPKVLEKPTRLAVRTWRYEGAVYLAAADIKGNGGGHERIRLSDRMVEIDFPDDGVVVMRLDDKETK